MEQNKAGGGSRGNRNKHKSAKNQERQRQGKEGNFRQPRPEPSPSSSRRIRRKHLDDRLRILHQRAMAIEREIADLDEHKFYRVCIFGSARIKPETPAYDEVFTLARYLSWQGLDILTGGGPGLMEAANKGARLGKEEKKSKSLSFGLSIQLEWEPEPNNHLDINRHHHKFSSRLDDFIRLSNAIVATPGGVGTLLELYFSWQLIQVNHIPVRPIVLLNRSFWNGLIEWMEDKPLADGLMGAQDFSFLSVVDTPEEVAEIILKHREEYKEKYLAIEREQLKK